MILSLNHIKKLYSNAYDYVIYTKNYCKEHCEDKYLVGD